MGNRTSISFIILTGGERTASLTALCDSIAAHQGDNPEIIVIGGERELSVDRLSIIYRPDLAEAGEICRMRNVAAEEASGEILLFLDDDIEIAPTWFNRIETLFEAIRSKRADIGTCRVVGPGGGRWYDWSWASRKNPACPTMLLPYHWHSRNLYVSGCCMIMREDVWRDLRFADDRGYYQNDDIEFCHRASDSGYRFQCRGDAEIKHLLLPGGRADSMDAFTETIYLYRLGKIAQAFGILESARPEIEPGIYWYYKGYFSLLLRNIVESRSALERSVDALTAGGDTTLLGQALYRLGLTQLMTGRRDEAEDCFHRVLEVVPDHPFAHARLNRMHEGYLGLRGILLGDD